MEVVFVLKEKQELTERSGGGWWAGGGALPMAAWLSGREGSHTPGSDCCDFKQDPELAPPKFPPLWNKGNTSRDLMVFSRRANICKYLEMPSIQQTFAINNKNINIEYHIH